MQTFPGLLPRLPVAVVTPGGIIRDQMCPGASEAWRSRGTEPRGMTIAWTMPRIRGRTRTRARARATARITTGVRTGARAGARNRARAGARNRAMARAKVICSIGIPSNMGNVGWLKAKPPMACLVGKSGSRVALPKTVRGGLHEKAPTGVGR